jgi:hypothetical protein
MGAIVIRTRYDEGTESAEVATSGDTYFDVIVERMSEVRKGTSRNTKNENKRHKHST